MLIELRINNFAIIDQLELEFGEGFISFTGETGAGKSIIIDAVETLLGVRADTSFIRSGVERSSVEGTFSISPKLGEIIHPILEREDLTDDPKYLTLSREFRREGRNIARINGRTANLSILRELGEYLIDLHGQSEHLSLLRIKSHLGLLDRYASVDTELSQYRGVFDQLNLVRKELTNLRQSETDAAKRVELLTFQVDEITVANLIVGEEEKLLEERVRLANAEALAKYANTALSALDESTPEIASTSDRLGEVVSALTDLVKLDTSQEKLGDQSQELFDGITELAAQLRNYLEEIEFNPSRLEEVEDRLDLLGEFKRKYGDTIPAILEYSEKAQKELDSITHAEERMKELEEEEIKLLTDLAEKAAVLSDKRHQAADRLSSEIENQLNDLRMSGAKFGVDFRTRVDNDGIMVNGSEPVAFDSNGFETVEFLVEPNPGEGLKPLVKIASGGETARLMLALKNVLADADQTPTLIFDEIDQGIGGRVGTVVGQKLWDLGRQHQVLCITHLPQLAGFGDQHYKVDKIVKDGRTITQVDELTGDGRIMELAQMLGEVSEGTLRSAHELLQSVNDATSAKLQE